MSIAAVVWIALMASNLMLYLIKHGEERGKFNFWYGLLSVAIEAGILAWGGFFARR